MGLRTCTDTIAGLFGWPDEPDQVPKIRAQVCLVGFTRHSCSFMAGEEIFDLVRQSGGNGIALDLQSDRKEASFGCPHLKS